MSKQLQSIQVKLSKSGELRKQWIMIIDKMKKLDNILVN